MYVDVVLASTKLLLSWLLGGFKLCKYLLLKLVLEFDWLVMNISELNFPDCDLC